MDDDRAQPQAVAQAWQYSKVPHVQATIHSTWAYNSCTKPYQYTSQTADCTCIIPAHQLHHCPKQSKSIHVGSMYPIIIAPRLEVYPCQAIISIMIQDQQFSSVWSLYLITFDIGLKVQQCTVATPYHNLSTIRRLSMMKNIH